MVAPSMSQMAANEPTGGGISTVGWAGAVGVHGLPERPMGGCLFLTLLPMCIINPGNHLPASLPRTLGLSGTLKGFLSLKGSFYLLLF